MILPRDLSFINIVLFLQFLVVSNWSKQRSHMIYMNNCEGTLIESLVRTICMKKGATFILLLLYQNLFCVIIQVGNNVTIMQINEYI